MQKKSNMVLTILGSLLCLILIPILTANIILIVKSYVDKEHVPNIGGVTPMIVLTDSMYPVIEGGDLIICHAINAEEVEVGDVISFFDPAGNGTSVVTHRVTEITQDASGDPVWRTKGDANNSEDKELVPFDKLVGKWTGTRFAGLGNVAMFMQTSTGLVVCVILPLLLLVGYDILRRRLFEKKNEENTESLMKELEELRRLKAEKAEPNKE